MNRAAMLVALLAATTAGADERMMTYAQAVDLALEKNPQLRLARAAVAAAEAKLRGTRRLRLPALTADANVTVWDKALTFELGGTPLPAGFDSTIRDRVTAAASLTLTQPITGLALLGTLIGVQRDASDIAVAEGDTARLDVAARAGEAFLRALQARAGLEIGKKSLEQLDAELVRAQILEKGGALGRVDVLRIQSARDSARQSVLKAEAAAATAGRALLLAVGLPSGGGVDARDDLPDPPPPPPWTEEQAVAAAAAHRPELRAARERVDQAEGARRVAFAPYLPDVRALASYQFSQGNSTFQAKSSWYVGLTLHWALWDWGKTGADVDEAAAHRQQAEIGAETLADAVAFEARRLALDAATAYQTLDVAASALRAAEEAYRIQSVRYAQGAATTTDVLESETEVARARSAMALARYDYFLSLSALARSVGELPRFQVRP